MLFWTKEEVEYFFNHKEVKNHYYFDFMRTAVNMGMRGGEIAGLQVKKIDFVTNTIIISNGIKYTEEGYRLGRTRNGRVRYLKMNPIVRKIMEKRVQDKNPDDFIFLDKKGEYIKINTFAIVIFRPLQKKLE